MKNQIIRVREYKRIFGNNVHEPTQQDFINYIKLCAVMDCKSEFTGTLLPENAAFEIFKGLYK